MADWREVFLYLTLVFYAYSLTESEYPPVRTFRNYIFALLVMSWVMYESNRGIVDCVLIILEGSLVIIGYLIYWKFDTSGWKEKVSNSNLMIRVW